MIEAAEDTQREVLASEEMEEYGSYCPATVEIPMTSALAKQSEKPEYGAFTLYGVYGVEAAVAVAHAYEDEEDEYEEAGDGTDTDGSQEPHQHAHMAPSFGNFVTYGVFGV